MNIDEVAKSLEGVLYTLPEVANQFTTSRLHEGYQIHHLTAIVWLLQSFATKSFILGANPTTERERDDKTSSTHRKVLTRCITVSLTSMI